MQYQNDKSQAILLNLAIELISGFNILYTFYHGGIFKI